MIIVTGAYGFIGSCTCAFLRKNGYAQVTAVDDFSDESKSSNLPSLDGCLRIGRKKLFHFIDRNHQDIDFILHLGARTDTAEKNEQLLDELNTSYSKKVWNKCADYGIPLIYASSAATYGLGDLGYEDNHALVPRLEPLNPYGWSKQLFDLWAINQGHEPPCWFGLKFFNVYGPNEGHKGRMASVVFHAYNQIMENGHMNLFRSHHPDFADGQQSRDFIYIKDVLKVICWLMSNQGVPSGIYNVGTGLARTFESLALATFNALGIEPLINYIDTPEDIRETYQYFTKASMDKILSAGYVKDFISLEEGVEDYVKNYLIKGHPYV